MAVMALVAYNFNVCLCVSMNVSSNLHGASLAAAACPKKIIEFLNGRRGQSECGCASASAQALMFRERVRESAQRDKNEVSEWGAVEQRMGSIFQRMESRKAAQQLAKGTLHEHTNNRIRAL